MLVTMHCSEQFIFIIFLYLFTLPNGVRHLVTYMPRPADLLEMIHPSNHWDADKSTIQGRSKSGRVIPRPANLKIILFNGHVLRHHP